MIEKSNEILILLTVISTFIKLLRDIRTLKKDLDGVALHAGTERAKARNKRSEK